MILKHILFCACVLGHSFSAAQNVKIDSLKNLLGALKEDTNKVLLMDEIANSYRLIGGLDSSIRYGRLGLALGQKLNFKKGMASCHNNLGNAFYEQGNNGEALRNYLAALKLREEAGDKRSIAASLGNLGIVYTAQKNFDLSLQYNLRSLKIKKELGNIKGMAATYNNLGALYHAFGKEDEALFNFTEALKIWLVHENKLGLAYCYNNIGGIFSSKKKYSEALENFFASLKIKEEIGDQQGIGVTCTNIGTVLIQQKKYDQAKFYVEKGLRLAKEVKSDHEMKNAYEAYAQLDSALGNYSQAYEHYKLFIAFSDSMVNEENTKKIIQTQMQYDFDKKQVADSIRNAEQFEQESLKHDQKIREQKIYSYGGIIGLLLMVVVAAVAFYAYRQKQKANAIITEQKTLVEMKQKEVLDSIYYAHRIQKALLPSETFIAKILSRLNVKK